jgi:type IV pilus assembly protein PilC
MYPCILIVMVIFLMVFLVTFVVPRFATLYATFHADLPYMTRLLITIGTAAQGYFLGLAGAIVAGFIGFRIWSRRESARNTLDRIKLRVPGLGEIWLKYQVAQLARILSTLLTGGIPLVQALETAGESLNTPLLKRAVENAGKSVREGQPLSKSLQASKFMPGLAIDMIEVGESTGALPAMLNSVAEFFEDDVSVKMQALLSLIEPAIMLVMGTFVAFVLVALYLPIFSLADSIR